MYFLLKFYYCIFAQRNNKYFLTVSIFSIFIINNRILTETERIGTMMKEMFIILPTSLILRFIGKFALMQI